MEEKGNNIFSKEEEIIAEYLRNKNLENANSVSQEVTPKVSFYTKYGKRIIDLVVIIPVIILLIPVYIILTLLNYIDMGAPIIYKQTRYGYKGKTYNMLKFRSMKNILDSEGRQLSPNQRLTKYGRLIRKLSLDELPNLFNILKGEMSIIGPRAVPMVYAHNMSERHKMMSAVRPGLECPRVIEVENADKLSGYHICFENNIWYVENVSLLVDIKMFFLLIKMVFSIKQRSRNAGGASFFVGYDDKGYAISTTLAKKIYGEEFFTEHTEML